MTPFDMVQAPCTNTGTASLASTYEVGESRHCSCVSRKRARPPCLSFEPPSRMRPSHDTNLLVSQLLCCVVLLRLHPLPLIYTPSYEFSVSFAGVAFGTATGLRRAKHLHVAGALLPVLWRQGGVIAVVRRLALGELPPPDVGAAATFKPSPCACVSPQRLSRAGKAAWAAPAPSCGGSRWARP